jgi:hypothetical protein
LIKVFKFQLVVVCDPLLEVDRPLAGNVIDKEKEYKILSSPFLNAMSRVTVVTANTA